MLGRNVEMTPKPNLSAWDKISVGSWTVNGDSQVYVELKLPVAKALLYLEKKNQKSEVKLTITHFLGVVMGRVLKEVPDMNVIMRFSKIYFRDEVNIFFHIADKGDLSGHCIHNIDRKNIEEIGNELNLAAKNVRGKNDPAFKKIKSTWSMVPIQLSKPFLGFIRLIAYGLNLNLAKLGVPKDAFGSMMITNIGSLGFDSAYVPLSPYTQVPLIFALGKMKYEPVCDDKGEIHSEKRVSICVTFDHRVIDGYRGSKVSAAIKKYFENPDLLS